MNSKVTKREDIINKFQDGQTLIIGGFAKHGSPNELIQCVIDSGKKHFTVISIDSGEPDITIGRLIRRGLVDKIICADIAGNPEAISLIDSGDLKLELIPQGSWAEKVRCGGAGLGGVLTKTGMGTIIEDEREVIYVKGENFLLEPSIRGDIALVHSRKADTFGNLTYRGTSRNTNPLVATAADFTIVEADMLVEIDEIGVDNIVTPGVFIDMILER